MFQESLCGCVLVLTLEHTGPHSSYSVTSQKQKNVVKGLNFFFKCAVSAFHAELVIMAHFHNFYFKMVCILTIQLNMFSSFEFHNSKFMSAENRFT